jgi:hypothetical protein
MSTQTAMNPNMAYYLSIWQEMLAIFLGWSAEQVLQWAERTGKLGYMADPDDLFYHETPQYWVKSLLVPDELRGRLSTVEAIGLEQRILAAFKDVHHYEFPLGTDWRPFRKKVEHILNEYGASLGRPGATDDR